MRLKNNLSIFAVGFILNYIWEITHSFLYIHNAVINLKIHLLLASIIDSLIILGLYWAMVLINKDYAWFYKARAKDYIIVLLLGLAISVFIENRAIYETNDWGYTEQMPLLPIFKIGLTPILQMLILPLTTFALVKRIFKLSNN